MLLSIITCTGLDLATADIKGAYLQSCPIRREIYVRPPRERHSNNRYKRGILWKLTKLPYGIVEAGRQWQKKVEYWMMTQGKLRRVFGISQLFIRRTEQGEIYILVANVTDDFLIGGKTDHVHEFIKRLKESF